MRTIAISELDIPSITDAEIEELNDFGNLLRAESQPDDPPYPLEQAHIGWRNIPAFWVPRSFVARDASGDVVATADASWERASTNQHIINVGISVHPSFRRRRIGTDLLRICVDAADAAGKTMIFGRSNDRMPGADAFARAIGAEAAMIGHTNRLVIADVDRSMIDGWVEDGPKRAPGYSLVLIDGPVPDDLVEQFVSVQNVMNTAPREGLEMEDWNLTVEDLRALEKSQFAHGSERRFIAARHDETGDFVGFTEMWRNPHSQPRTIYQWGTGVRPDHRGHALGKWLKAANIQRALEEWPDVVDIRTHNADSNEPMLGINHALGFKPYTSDINWQVNVDSVREHLASL